MGGGGSRPSAIYPVSSAERTVDRGEFSALYDLFSGALQDISLVKKKFLVQSRLCIFVSSTFTDTHRERNILQERMLPLLQQKYRKEEIQIVFSDMRFGIKDENTTDHLTWILCKEELRRCYEESEGLFFLSLQNDKYGYLSLPKYVSKADYEDRIHRLDPEKDRDVIELCRDWYKLDANQVPPHYELRKLATKKDYDEFFSRVLGTLRDRVFDSYQILESLRSPVDLKVNRSVTEWETRYALTLDPSRCYWTQRRFDRSLFLDEKTKTNKYPLLCDVEGNELLSSRLSDLKRFMSEKLDPLDAHRVLSPVLAPRDYEADSVPGRSYLQNWEESVMTKITEEIESLLVKKRKFLGLNRDSLGLPGVCVEELFHHYQLASQKALSFFGRDSLVQQCLDLIRRGREKKPGLSSAFGYGSLKSLDNICLSIIGRSGSGKTGLMSKLVTEVRRTSTGIPVIVRFCGTSKHSQDIDDLLFHIIMQIWYLYDRDERYDFYSKPRPTWTQLREIFHKLLRTYPVYLFIDSLDQLSNANRGRSELSFMQGLANLHPSSRIVVSCLPDEFDEVNKKWVYCYLCDTKLKESNVPRVNVPLLGEGSQGDHDDRETREIICQVLERKYQRSLQDSSQLDVIVEATREEPTILYVNLALEIASRWRSFEKDVALTPTVKGIIDQLFSSFELQYGRRFTSVALALLTYAKDGLNDSELMDLVSLDEEVLTEVFQYATPGNVKRIPLHVWLRLKMSLKNILVEQTQSRMKWYHRQIWETLSDRYRALELTVHRLLGKYFTNRISEEIRRERLITPQELSLNNSFAWFPDFQVNVRRIGIGLFHLRRAELFEEVIDEICDVQRWFAVMKSGAGSDWLSQSVELYKFLLSPKGKNAVQPESLERFTEFFFWLRRDKQEILRRVDGPLDDFLLYVAKALASGKFIRENYLQQFQALKKASQQIALAKNRVGFPIVTVPNDQHQQGINQEAPSSFDPDLIAPLDHATCGEVAVNSVGYGLGLGPDGLRQHAWNLSNGELLSSMQIPSIASPDYVKEELRGRSWINDTQVACVVERSFERLHYEYRPVAVLVWDVSAKQIIKQFSLVRLKPVATMSKYWERPFVAWDEHGTFLAVTQKKSGCLFIGVWELMTETHCWTRKVNVKKGNCLSISCKNGKLVLVLEEEQQRSVKSRKILIFELITGHFLHSLATDKLFNQLILANPVGAKEAKLHLISTEWTSSDYSQFTVHCWNLRDLPANNVEVPPSKKTVSPVYSPFPPSVGHVIEFRERDDIVVDEEVLEMVFEDSITPDGEYLFFRPPHWSDHSRHIYKISPANGTTTRKSLKFVLKLGDAAGHLRLFPKQQLVLKRDKPTTNYQARFFLLDWDGAVLEKVRKEEESRKRSEFIASLDWDTVVLKEPPEIENPVTPVRQWEVEKARKEVLPAVDYTKQPLDLESNRNSLVCCVADHLKVFDAETGDLRADADVVGRFPNYHTLSHSLVAGKDLRLVPVQPEAQEKKRDQEHVLDLFEDRMERQSPFDLLGCLPAVSVRYHPAVQASFWSGDGKRLLVLARAEKLRKQYLSVWEVSTGEKLHEHVFPYGFHSFEIQQIYPSADLSRVIVRFRPFQSTVTVFRHVLRVFDFRQGKFLETADKRTTGDVLHAAMDSDGSRALYRRESSDDVYYVDPSDHWKVIRKFSSVIPAKRTSWANYDESRGFETGHCDAIRLHFLPGRDKSCWCLWYQYFHRSRATENVVNVISLQTGEILYSSGDASFVSSYSLIPPPLPPLPPLAAADAKEEESALPVFPMLVEEKYCVLVNLIGDFPSP